MKIPWETELISQEIFFLNFEKFTDSLSVNFLMVLRVSEFLKIIQALFGALDSEGIIVSKMCVFGPYFGQNLAKSIF